MRTRETFLAASILLALNSLASEFNAEHSLAFLKNHCADCHSGEKSKGQFDLTKLSTEIKGDGAIRQWGRILMRVEAGEMPPPEPDAERLPNAETNLLLGWAKRSLATELDARRAKDGRTRMRRLNRLEYENTLHDLLGIETSLADLLPQDDFANGFDTSSSALSISPVHVQQYMAAAETALKAAIIRTPQPEKKVTRFQYDPEKEKYFMGHGNNSPVIRPRNGGEVIFFAEPHIEVPAKLTQFSELTKNLPGRYRVRVSAYTNDAKDASLTYLIRTVRSRKLLGYFNAPPDKPGVVEVEHYFEPQDTVIVAPYLLNRARGERGFSQYPPKPWVEPSGIGLAIQWVEVEGPLYETWPPEGHRTLFGDVPLKMFKDLAKDAVTPGDLQRFRGSDKLTPIPIDTEKDAGRLLATFLARAFRRPVNEEDIQPYLAIVKSKLEKKECFESAMTTAYQAALCSPDFLFLVEEPERLSDHALAARLSYFLWRSSPDATLRAAADKGELRKPDILRRETERLLASPRSNAFVVDFLDHWLHLRDIDATTPDKLLYPEFFEKVFDGTPDGLLRESFLAETRMFFADLLKNDGSTMQLIDSDFTYLNNRLAEHYGLPAVNGAAMQRVALPADSLRGGIMTQASVLKVTANGSLTSPVLRGAWLLDNILGRSPPPPPPNVGTIEPDTRGATTIREQLAKHQNVATCAACHRQIDPPGFAMECFDPAGQQRTYYRATETGKKLEVKFVDGASKHHVKYKQGVDVDPSGETANGQKFKGPKEFKKIVLQQPDIVVRNLAAKLLTYSTGQRTEPGDLQALDALTARVKQKNYGLRTLVHEVVQSELFSKK